MDKSYVTMAICPICKKETGELLMDMGLRKRFEMHTMTPNPCGECKEKYLKNGVMLINPESGDLMVLKTSAYKRVFNVPVPKNKIAFCEQRVLEHLYQIGGANA